MWDFFETVRNRHSIRKYRDNAPVENEKLHAILEMACAAPSAGDLQSYKIVVIADQEDRKRLEQAAEDQPFISQAPICLAFCADPERSADKYGDRGRNLYAIQDATIAATFAQLAIVAAGMGSTWVGHFNDKAVAEILKLDKGIVPVALLSIGYPADIPEQSNRRRLDDVVKHL